MQNAWPVESHIWAAHGICISSLVRVRGICLKFEAKWLVDDRRPDILKRELLFCIPGGQKGMLMRYSISISTLVQKSWWVQRNADGVQYHHTSLKELPNGVFLINFITFALWA